MKIFARVIFLMLPVLASAQSAKSDTVSPSPGDTPRLIRLQGALNARDLGGEVGSSGPIPYGNFIRTADLSHLTDADKNSLAQRHVALDIDLRTPDEAKKDPDALAGDDRFKYMRISLLGDKSIDLTHMHTTLGDVYVQALSDDQPAFKQVFAAMAAQKEGAILYHCTAGKDRTGMITALLLELAGVSRTDIVHNYAVSAYYLQPMMASDAMQAMIKKYPALVPMLGTPPSEMGRFLDVLDTKYGGARQYLRTIGLSEAQIEALIMRFS